MEATLVLQTPNTSKARTVKIRLRDMDLQTLGFLDGSMFTSMLHLALTTASSHQTSLTTLLSILARPSALGAHLSFLGF